MTSQWPLGYTDTQATAGAQNESGGGRMDKKPVAINLLPASWKASDGLPITSINTPAKATPLLKEAFMRSGGLPIPLLSGSQPVLMAHPPGSHDTSKMEMTTTNKISEWGKFLVGHFKKVGAKPQNTKKLVCNVSGTMIAGHKHYKSVRVEEIRDRETILAVLVPIPPATPTPAT